MPMSRCVCLGAAYVVLISSLVCTQRQETEIIKRDACDTSHRCVALARNLTVPMYMYVHIGVSMLHNLHASILRSLRANMIYPTCQHVIAYMSAC